MDWLDSPQREGGGGQGSKSPFSLLSEPISPSSLLFEPISPSSLLFEPISPSSLLFEPISPSSLLFEPISPSSLNGYVSFSPSLLFPPISPSSQLFSGHFSLLSILFLPPPQKYKLEFVKFCNFCKAPIWKTLTLGWEAIHSLTLQLKCLHIQMNVINIRNSPQCSYVSAMGYGRLLCCNRIEKNLELAKTEG